MIDSPRPERDGTVACGFAVDGRVGPPNRACESLDSIQEWMG